MINMHSDDHMNNKKNSDDHMNNMNSDDHMNNMILSVMMTSIT